MHSKALLVAGFALVFVAAEARAQTTNNNTTSGQKPPSNTAPTTAPTSKTGTSSGH